MDWFKIYQDGILRGSLSRAPDTTQLIWVKLLAIENETRQRDGWLHYAPGRPMTRDYLAMICGVSTQRFNEAIQEFLGDVDGQGRSRIEIAPDGDIFIKNWGKYQAKSSKAIAKEVAIEKAKQTSRTKDSAVVGAIRAVNELTTATRVLTKRIDNIKGKEINTETDGITEEAEGGQSRKSFDTKGASG